jgi:hypothetical protein
MRTCLCIAALTLLPVCCAAGPAGGPEIAADARSAAGPVAQDEITGAAYHSPDAIAQRLLEIAARGGESASLHLLAKTPGGRDLQLLELGPEGAPAVLVIANMAGDAPLASEAALALADRLAGDWSDACESTRWYIVPCGNPDGYTRFFEKPLAVRHVNARPFNDDNDDAIDEDGPEDLNSDGCITVMRQAHPEGEWMPVEGNPVLLRKADAAKGEAGVYRLFPEGLDNDGDGAINEDGPGGANPGLNFPHDFEHYTVDAGRWAASESESRGVLRFAFDHPDIAMVLVFGRSNTLLNVPGSAGGETDGRYSISARMAERLGVEPGERFTLDELVEMSQGVFGSREMTPERMQRYIGTGPAEDVDASDLAYWEEVGARYEAFLEGAGLDGARIDPPDPAPGAVEDWAYYQYGVPSFALDFWTVPEAEADDEDEADGDGNGDEKEGALHDRWKERGPPGRGGRDEDGRDGGATEDMEAALFAYRPGAFLAWESFDHPDLGAVEIGGMQPYADLAPPPGEIAGLIDRQLPFVRELAALVPAVRIAKLEAKRTSGSVWKVDAWIKNEGFLPFPTRQGMRCGRPTPAAVTIAGEGLVLIEGRERVVLGQLEGSGGVRKVSWMIHVGAGTEITVETTSFSAGHDSRTVTLKGEG